MPPQVLNKGLNRGIFIIHSKIFPYFWLVKTTHIIHHKQLLLTKFGKNFVIMKRWHQNAVKSAAWLQVIEPVNKKTWGRGWVVLVVGTKWRKCRGTFYLFHNKILSKNITEQQEYNSTDNTSAIWVYLQTRADLNLLNFPICIIDVNLHRPRLACFRLFLNLELFWRNIKTILNSAFVGYSPGLSCSKAD